MLEEMGGLRESERSRLLDAEVDRYIGLGYRLIARTPTTAQLTRPKTFDLALAIIGLLLCTIGLWIYLFYYVSKTDEAVYLTVSENGEISRQFSGGSTARWRCEECGYENLRSRDQCKRCRHLSQQDRAA